MIIQLDIRGNPNIGSLGVANDEFCLISDTANSSEISRLAEALKAEVKVGTIGGLHLIGSLTALNGKGMLVSNIVEARELEMFSDLEPVVLDSKLNALGNNIVCNDKGALVNPRYRKSEIEAIRDALGVDVQKGTIAGLKIVGSCSRVTNKGFICHPKVDDDELEFMNDLFGVKGEIGTGNFGGPHVGSAIMANGSGAATGTPTTGIELGRIEEALVLYDE